jgi:TonB family protein
LPRDERIFGDIVDPSIKLGSNQGKSIGFTIFLEALIIALIVIIPLMATDILPTPPSMMAFVAAPPPPGGVVGGVVGGLPEAPPPPPPPTQPVRVGGQIKQPTKLKHVNPVYPPIAQSARVQGVVIIEAVIGPNGKVQDARVLRSIPLLDQAALDAVKQWEFSPTLLNNVPVPVIMTVTVQFTLS